MDKEIEQLHTKLGRSRFAVFLIIGFLFLITYLLIVVSRGVSDEQAMNLSSSAVYQSPQGPQFTGIPDKPKPITPGTLASCSNYKEYVSAIKQYLIDLRMYLGCNITPTGAYPSNPPPVTTIYPSVTVSLQENSSMTPDFVPHPCERTEEIQTYLNGLTEFMAKMCLSCGAGSKLPVITPNPY